VLWHEVLPYLTAAGLSTSRLRVGPLVCNPVTRDPTVIASSVATLAELFDGRATLGLGRGDSAVRVMGRQPMSVKDFRIALRWIRSLCQGQEVDIQGTKLRLSWLTRRVPVLVAAYGPRVLQLAGEFADGVVLQLAAPAVVEWAVGHARRGAEVAGRDWTAYEVLAGAPSYISADRERALSRVRGFPATVSNHVKDVLRRSKPGELPVELVEGMDRITDYDYLQHGHHDAPHARAVTDEMAERLTLVGTVEQVREKIGRLAQAGATQVCLYMGPVEAENHVSLLETYGREIIPAFR
jgi:alkanesulfonate monooxygenase SsuD/methylene tetrahydromethanopterin reductase-like flavin-dependent oxidoreductase (luciferase family)